MLDLWPGPFETNRQGMSVYSVETRCFLMTRRVVRSLVLVALCMMATAGWAEQNLIASSPLRAEDVVHIKVLNNKGLSEVDQEFLIDPAGKIDLPLLGFYTVGGLTVTDLERKLSKELSEKVLKGPRVQARIVKQVLSDKVYVFGGVKKPGTVMIRDRMSVLDVIREAGGLEEDNSLAGMNSMTYNQFDPKSFQSTYMTTPTLDFLRDTKLKRSGKEIAVNLQDLISKGDIAQNIDLVNNDILIVPRRGEVTPELKDTIYVLGAVSQPARYRFRKGMSIMDAVQLSGGLEDKHHVKAAMIFRGDYTDKKNLPKPIEVDLRRLYFRGDVTQDQMLQPGDIVYVSTRKYMNVLSKLGDFIDKMLPVVNRMNTVVGYDDSIRRFNDRFLK